MVRKNMGYPDIERARDGQAALRRIIEDYAGPGVDSRALRRVVDLCREVQDAIEDDYCREKVRAIAEYSAELLSQAEHLARGARSAARWSSYRAACTAWSARAASGSASPRPALARCTPPSAKLVHPG